MRESSKKPTQKVFAGGVAGGLTVVLVWLLTFVNVDMPPEVASALTVIFASGAAYIKEEK